MGFSKKDLWFLAKAVLCAAGLPVALVAVWALCVDWRGPLDDMDARDREALEGCIMAERSLGDSIYRERPDCRAVLEPARHMAAAKH